MAITETYPPSDRRVIACIAVIFSAIRNIN